MSELHSCSLKERLCSLETRMTRAFALSVGHGSPSMAVKLTRDAHFSSDEARQLHLASCGASKETCNASI